MIEPQDHFILFLVNNIFCAFLLTVMLIGSKNIFRHKTALRVFRNAVEVVLFMILMDLCYLMIAFGIIKNINIGFAYLFKSLYFVTGLVAGYLWFVFLEVVLKSKFSAYKPHILLSSSIAIIGIILIIINYFTHFIFKIYEYGNGYMYERNNFGFIIYYVLVYTYALFSCIRCHSFARKKENYIESHKYLMFGYFALIPFVFGILQLILINIPFALPSVTFSVFLICIYTANDQISTDYLTELLNRRQVLLDIEKTIKGKIDDLYVVFLLDLNNFKIINDVHGHIEGDNALKYVSEALTIVSSYQNHKMIVGRFGGDEFIIASHVNTNYDIEKIIEDINIELENQSRKYDTSYKIEASIGYSIYNENIESVKDLVDAADLMLYNFKKKNNIGR